MGRPRIVPDDLSHKVCISIDAFTRDVLIAIGEGNASVGARKLVRMVDAERVKQLLSERQAVIAGQVAQLSAIRKEYDK